MVEKDQLVNDLIEAKEELETLREQYDIPDIDPLWRDPIETIEKIIKELEG